MTEILPSCTSPSRRLVQRSSVRPCRLRIRKTRLRLTGSSPTDRRSRLSKARNATVAVGGPFVDDALGRGQQVRIPGDAVGLPGLRSPGQSCVQLGPADADDLRDPAHGEPSRRGNGGSQLCFFTRYLSRASGGSRSPSSCDPASVPRREPDLRACEPRKLGRRVRCARQPSLIFRSSDDASGTTGSAKPRSASRRRKPTFP